MALIVYLAFVERSPRLGVPAFATPVVVLAHGQ